MTLVRWNPWNEMFALHNQIDQLFGEMVGGSGNGGERRGAAEYSNLPVDIRQTDEAFVIEASVPGFAPENVEVTFDDGMLTIRGQREQSEEQKSGDYVRRERRTSSVFRQVGLPSEVRADEITATFDNGVLAITVPRAQKAQPKRIPVQSSGKVIDAPAGK